jgi:hypothetical protein
VFILNLLKGLLDFVLLISSRVYFEHINVGHIGWPDPMRNKVEQVCEG